MAKRLHTSLTSPCEMQSVCWSGVNHSVPGLWSSGNVSFGVINHTSLSGSLIDESEQMPRAVFSWFGLGHLVPVKGLLNAKGCKDI